MNTARPRWPWVLAALCVIALLPRLWNVTAPPLGVHSWRQADTAAMARNYSEEGTPFHMPKIDWGRPGPGYVETEFPLYPYVASLGYRAIGSADEVVPRLLAIAGSLVGLIFLYRLVAEEIDERTAAWAGLFFALLPMSVYYGRAIMPEAWMLGAGIAGVTFFARWSRGGHEMHLLAAFGFVTLACLLKLPMLHIGLPLAYLAWRRLGWRMFTSATMWLFGIATLACVALWYVHAAWVREVHHLSFGISGSTKWGDPGAMFTGEFARITLWESVVKKHLALFGLPLLFAGVVFPQRKGVWLFDIWATSLLVFMLITARGHILHEYYQMPFYPVLCVYLARPLALGLDAWRWPDTKPMRLTRFAVLAVLLLGMALVGGRTYKKYMDWASPEGSPQIRLAEIVQGASEPGQFIIVANGDGSWDPTMLYLAHRKGWADHPRFMTPRQLDRRMEHGTTLLIGQHEHLQREEDRRWLDAQLARFEVVHDDGEVFVLRLR